MTRNEAHLLKGGSGSLACALLLILALAVSLAVVPGVTPRTAMADDEVQAQESEATKTALELQQQIAEAQETYATAQDEVARANEEVEANRARIAELEKEIPAQEERSAKAARELYKIQQGGAGLTDLLLSSETFSDFLTRYEYITYVTDANITEMNRLAELKAQIDTTEEQLEAAQAEATAHMNDALAAIEELEAAQAEVQRRIEEEARQQAELAAAAAANAENPRDNDKPADDANGDGQAQAGQASQSESSSSADEQTTTEESPAETTSAPEPVAASSDEEAFIAEWAPRIDAYLAGSPLAGQGTAFARAAYTYDVDPRWSPAISYTESSKGAVCFLPHNAWGWGSSSWDNWEDAIDAHVRGLSRGYGYTISEDAAKKYCPPNWQHWYKTTSEQMKLI